MTHACWWVVEKLSRTLEPYERDAVQGDFVESGATGGQALRDLLGLIARRQAALWMDWRPWLALVGIVVPIGVMLNLVALKVGMLWWSVWDSEAWNGLRTGEEIAAVAYASLALILWAWTSGFVLGSLTRPAVWVHGALFFLALLGTDAWLVSQLSFPKSPLQLSHLSLVLQFVLFVFPSMAVLFVLPSIAGIRWGLRIGRLSVRQTIPLAASVMTTTVLMIWIVTQSGRSISTNWLHVLLPFAVV